MSDDSFIREVDEELRSDRMQNFWKRYGKIIIGVAIAVIAITGGYRAYEYYSSQKAAKAGDAFMNAVKLSDDGKRDEAVAALNEMQTDSGAAYVAMAKMRSASELAQQGKSEDAIKQYDAVSADTSIDENFRSIARIRAGMLLVDFGTVPEVEDRVGALAAPGAPYRGSAREALGLAYYKAGDLEKAFKQFEAISSDDGSPAQMRQRVRIMLDVIAAQGGPVRKN